MTIDPKFKLRSIAGEHIVVRQGECNIDMTRVISLNKTAVELWETFEGNEFSLADAAGYLAATYHIDPERAMQDAGKWAAQLTDCGIIKD